jgi:hypothetical protein
MNNVEISNACTLYGGLTFCFIVGRLRKSRPKVVGDSQGRLCVAAAIT